MINNNIINNNKEENEENIQNDDDMKDFFAFQEIYFGFLKFRLLNFGYLFRILTFRILYFV